MQGKDMRETTRFTKRSFYSSQTPDLKKGGIGKRGEKEEEGEAKERAPLAAFLPLSSICSLKPRGKKKEKKKKKKRKEKSSAEGSCSRLGAFFTLHDKKNRPERGKREKPTRSMLHPAA